MPFPVPFNQIPEGSTIMFRQIIRFFRRFFQSKGVRTAARIIFWILAGYFVFTYFYTVFYLMRNIDGMSFHEATTFILDTLFMPFSRISMSIILGGIIGIMGYFRGRKKKTEAEEEEKPAEKTEPEAVKEEEIIETKHYMFH